jgi:hypothetical protein
VVLKLVEGARQDREVSKSFGVSTLRWRIEKKISTWLSQLAWVGRWTKIRFGQRPSRRSIDGAGE